MAKATLTARIKANVNGMAKSGATTLALVQECIEHMHGDSNDGSKLCLLVSLLPSGDAKRVKDIVKAACGVTFKSSKTANEGMVAKRAKDEEAVDLMHVLAAHVERGHSFRSDALSVEIGNLPALLAPKEKVDMPFESRVDAVIRAGVRDGLTLDQIKNVMAARLVAAYEAEKVAA